MGTAQFKQKNKNTNSLIQPPKVSIKVEVDIDKPIPLQLIQLTNWSLSQVKNTYQSFQRIAQSPMLDSFLFKKIIPLSKKNCQIMFNILSKNGKFLSIYELICILVLTSYQTYRKKFQFLSLIFDFQHKGNVNGRQFTLIFYSMLYGYCRLTDQQLPRFDTVERFGLASLFPGEEDYETKSISLRKFIDQYDGNSNISHIFNRFQQNQLKQIKQDPLIYVLSEFKKYPAEDFAKFYRIVYKIYSKNDYEQIYMIEHNKQLRRQNRRDSCYRNLIQQKNAITYELYDSRFRIRKSLSLAKTNKEAINLKNGVQEKQKNQIKNTQLKIRKMQSIMSVKNSVANQISNSRSQSSSKIKAPPVGNSKLLFLNGHTHSKNEIFQTINYFKSFSDNEEKVTIKQFFKKFDKDVFLKKQLSSIFKYLDYGSKGEITMQGFFRSFYPGVKQKDLKVLDKWYTQYQQIYEADSLKRNRAKITVMSDGRVLPIDTLERMRQIFKAIDTGDKGFINLEDLRKAFQHGFTVDELENLLKQYGDGQKIRLNGVCKMLLPFGWVIQGVDLNNIQL